MWSEQFDNHNLTQASYVLLFYSGKMFRGFPKVYTVSINSYYRLKPIHGKTVYVRHIMLGCTKCWNRLQFVTALFIIQTIVVQNI